MKLAQYILILLSIILSGCSVKSEVSLSNSGTLSMPVSNVKVENKILALEKAIRLLSPEVNAEEAKEFSRIVVLYPLYLAQGYALVSPAYVHNFFVIVGLKERGLCYHWASDLTAHLEQQKFKSFDLYRAVAEQGNIGEHNSIVVTAKDQPFSSGIVLDAWRYSSDLYFQRVTEDKDYNWIENKKYKVIKSR